LLPVFLVNKDIQNRRQHRAAAVPYTGRSSTTAPGTLKTQDMKYRNTIGIVTELEET